MFHGLCCKSVADQLLEQATNESNRAGLLASKAGGSGDWLDALSLQSVGLKLDNESVRVAAGLRLGAALVHPHRCVCEALVLADRHHGLACRKSAGQHSRHNQINDIVRFQVLRSSQLENHRAVVVIVLVVVVYLTTNQRHMGYLSSGNGHLAGRYSTP